MPSPGSLKSAGARCSLLFFSTPALWPHWPFLPVVRRRPGHPVELGLLFDALNACGKTGFSATVFKTNLLLAPADYEAFLELPREVYDTPEEIAAAGWSVD